MDNLMDQEMSRSGCTAVGVQDVDVCVPVIVKPFGKAGNITTKCLGKSYVAFGNEYCRGRKDGVCKFTITQKLRVEVPVIFGAEVEIGDASVECGGRLGMLDEITGEVSCGCDGLEAKEE